MISDAPGPRVTLGARYQLREVVGRGGMGEVWSATDLRLSRPVAVKVLSAQMASEANVRERFEVEARSAARLTHPNVVLVYDSGESEGTPFLVMELLPGRTLADEVALGALDPQRARRVGIEVLGALAASHHAGILHRDIKPGNVLLTVDDVAKVGDFGIAKSTEGLNLTSTGLIVGTAAYLAPERVTGEPASVQSDIYAVGVVLYEALSGCKPFEADTPIAIMRAVEAHDVVPLSQACPDLDPGLVATVERAMAKDPGERFASASDMIAALQSSPVAPVPGPTAPGDETVPDAAALGATQRISGPSATLVLPPSGASPTEVGRPGSTNDGGSRASAPQSHRRAIAASVAAVLFIVVLVIAIRAGTSSGPATTGAPSTAATSTPPVSVPAALDQALRHLEEAVRP